MFCAGRFEILIRARGLLVRGLKSTLGNRSGPTRSSDIFGERSDSRRICEYQSSKISIADLALADRARVLKFQNGLHKTRAIKAV